MGAAQRSATRPKPMRRALARPIAVAVLAVITSALGTPGASAAPGPTGPMGKVDSHLRELARDGAAGRDVYRRARAERLAATPGDRVVVDVYVRTDPAAASAQLRDAGLDVLATAGRGAFRVVEGRLAVLRIDDVARLGVTRGVLSVAGAGTDTGSVTSQGDGAHRGPQARAQGPTGSGIEVGVISDSINQVGAKVAGSQASGDLPPNVTVLRDQAGGSDEGRAMAEIIYDEAPGLSRFVFSSGTTAGPAAKAESIDDLRSAGVDVIADDVFMLDEPFFQDGVVVQAVDRARAAGISYFASAGNRARQSYQAAYRPSATPGFHDFDPGAGDDRGQTIATVPAGSYLQVALGWDEPVGAVQTDLDSFLVDAGTNAPLQSATSDSIITGRPNESVTWTNTTGAPVSVALRVERAAGSRSPFMKTIARGNFGSFAIAEHPTNSDTINPDAASARGALTTAAVASDDAGLDTPEPFSSRGPKTRLIDAGGNRLGAPEVRAKPEIAAADKVDTTVPGFRPFYGTSAATPSAAGIAALLLSASPAAGAQANDADDVAAIMGNPANAIDCTSAAGNPDADCGAGFVLADSSATQALDPSPPSISSAISPSTPAGRNGWQTGNVSVGWNVLDLGSPVTRRVGCDPVTIGSDTAGTQLTCTARSAGGAQARSVLVKRDTVKPAAPSIAGIGRRTYGDGAVPARRAIACRSSDATSGVASCAVTGYSASPGTHTLTAVAMDNAGLASPSTRLRYTVRDVTGPRISGASVVNRSFRVDARAKGARVGSAFRFRLNEAATVSFTIQRRAGRTRYTTQGTFRKRRRAGTGRVGFSGRIRRNGRTRSLKPGRYRVVLRGVDAARNRGRSVRLAFTILR